MADREQALLELSLREIYAKTTLFYYGEPATPPSAESTPRPVTPPKLSIGAPALDLEDGEIDEDGDLTPDARRSEAPTPRRGLRSWEIAERAPAPPPRSPGRPRQRRRRRALSWRSGETSRTVAPPSSLAPRPPAALPPSPPPRPLAKVPTARSRARR